MLFWLALHTLISSRLEYAKETRQQIRDLLMKSHSQFITMSNTVSQVKSLPSQSRTELLADAKELEAQLNEEYRDLEYSTFSGYSAGRWNPKLPTSPSVCIDTPTIAGQPWSKVMRIGLDTKQEIRAIKGQLLNRRNFPSQT